MSDNTAQPGAAFGLGDEGPDQQDVNTFDIKAWVKGTAPVTRSCTVYGKPHLMGEIEELIAKLQEEQAASLFDDDRLSSGGARRELAEQIEAKRREMFDSALRFRFRGLMNGELEEIKAEAGKELKESETDLDELDYRVYARQCVAPKGLDWTDFRALHTNLGGYFTRTIMKTAIEAVTGGGVDVPFSSASSALIENSSKN